jgi:hypothetical protein
VAPESEWRDGKIASVLKEWSDATKKAMDAGVSIEQLRKELEALGPDKEE